LSDTRAIDMPDVATAGWLERLSWALPLVFVLGAPSILITRFIFLRYYPDHFVGDSPTISETASHPPSSVFFEWTMALVTACIVVSWTLNILRNRRRLSELALGGVKVLGPSIAYGLASGLGICAGISLLLVAVYNLNNGHDVHMAGSWAFYITQATSITFDILFVLWLRRLAGAPPAGDGLLARVLVAAAIFLGSWFFLYMYESKDYATPEHKYAIQLVYVGAEYFVAMLFLAYPMTAYAEMRRHFREFAAADRRG
jgi:hypothetical protein